MKALKLSMIMLIMTIGLIQQSNAQQQSKGLYLTYNDYLNHKLSYGTDPNNPDKNKIYIHEFIGRNNVTVISDGKKQVIAKSEIFGYRDNTHDYRFYNNLAYQIDDATGFYIYSYEKLIPQLPGKGPRPTKVSFFSKEINGEILPLTSENIAKAFPDNTKFRFMVEVAAKTDIKLDAYDSISEQYKIKELYTASLK